MKGEIDGDFYCSGGFVANNGKVDFCTLKGGELGTETDCKRCNRFHRKHPTPAQFKEEYGGEYPDDGAVYWTHVVATGREPAWNISAYEEAKKEIKYASGYSNVSVIIVCACTPFGKPDRVWRPQ